MYLEGLVVVGCGEFVVFGGGVAVIEEGARILCLGCAVLFDP